jgi:hypothetical protein
MNIFSLSGRMRIKTALGYFVDGMSRKKLLSSMEIIRPCLFIIHTPHGRPEGAVDDYLIRHSSGQYPILCDLCIGGMRKAYM